MQEVLTDQFILTREQKQKIYIKKFEKISGFKVWIVNGKYIRTNIDTNFTNCGQHYQFKFIPKNELWIDYQKSPGEEKFFVDSLLVMHNLMSDGVSYNKAITAASRIEKRERLKSRLMNNEIHPKKRRKELIESVHKKFLKSYSNKKIKVWIVRGELVRDLFFITFTEGGHDVVYPFIPKNEIWIDDDLKNSETKFTLLHELYERNLMMRGKSYDRAHEKAIESEFYYRQNPRRINKRLRKEIRKSKVR
jgi:hypothetical protein